MESVTSWVLGGGKTAAGEEAKGERLERMDSGDSGFLSVASSPSVVDHVAVGKRFEMEGPSEERKFRSSESLRAMKAKTIGGSRFLCFKVGSKGKATLLFVITFVALLSSLSACFILAEAEAEIQRNRDYVDLMQRVKAQVEPELYDELVDAFGRDDRIGTQHFVEFSSSSSDWHAWSSQSFLSGFYYTFALATTIGYGDIVVHTVPGKLLTVVSIMLTLPFAIVTYTRVAELLSSFVMKLILKQSDEFQAVLRKYDEDGSGTLDRDELRAGFHDLGLELTYEQVDDLIEEFDDDGDKVLDIDEFAFAATELDVDAGKIARRALKLKFALLTLGFVAFLFALLVLFVFDLTVVDAFYYTIVTLSTVGLGDITPSPEVRAPITVPIFILLGLVALLIESITESLASEPETSQSDSSKASTRGVAESSESSCATESASGDDSPTPSKQQATRMSAPPAGRSHAALV